MYLMRIVYCSQVSPEFSPENIQEILSKAKKNNNQKHITGVLCFNRKYFLQCLEGDRKALNDTYHKILNDPRHSDIILLSYKDIDSRSFSSWGMAYIPEQNLTDAINLKYSGTPDFDPYTMSGDSSFNMLLELADSLPTI